MEFIKARDFRLRPGAVWESLKKSGKVVITSNGKPVAIMKDVEGQDLEEEWKTEIIADGIAALSRIRRKKISANKSTITSAEIESEIQKSRNNQ